MKWSLQDKIRSGSKIPTTSKMSDYDKINLKEKEIKNQNPKEK